MKSVFLVFFANFLFDIAPDSKSFLFTNSFGNLTLAYNPSFGRFPIGLGYSNNGGITWEREYIILDSRREENEVLDDISFAYPTSVEVEINNNYYLFTTYSINEQEIKLAISIMKP